MRGRVRNIDLATAARDRRFRKHRVDTIDERLTITEEGLARIAAAGLRPEQLPRHVAIIMDGNGRWAQQRGLPRIVGPPPGDPERPRRRRGRVPARARPAHALLPLGRELEAARRAS